MRLPTLVFLLLLSFNFQAIAEENKTCYSSYAADKSVDFLGYTYTGDCLNGRAHGKGKLTAIRNLAWYKGDFKNGHFHGEGTYMESGLSKKGTFKFNKLNGRCRIISTGEHRILASKKNFDYSGMCSNGEPHGIGQAVYDSGVTYSGNFHKGNFQGQGKLKTAKGVYEGAFKNNNPNGFGVYRFIAGGRHEGQFLNGKANGPGKFFMADGMIVQGNFVKGKLDGDVIFTLPDGKKVLTRHKNGKILGDTPAEKYKPIR